MSYHLSQKFIGLSGSMEKYRKISLDESRNVGHSSLLGDFITEWKKKETFIVHDFAKKLNKGFHFKTGAKIWFKVYPLQAVLYCFQGSGCTSAVTSQCFVLSTFPTHELCVC